MTPTTVMSYPYSSSSSFHYDDPSLDESAHAALAEQAVWRAVIVQALMDASSNSRKKENIQVKQEALVWLRGNSRDFQSVCYHAGFEPEFVRDMARKALARDCIWRAAPGTGEKAMRNREMGVANRTPTHSR